MFLRVETKKTATELIYSLCDILFASLFESICAFVS